jgi:hypothetical protein
VKRVKEEEMRQVHDELSLQLSIVGDIIQKIHPLNTNYNINFDWADKAFKLTVEDAYYRYIDNEKRSL